MVEGDTNPLILDGRSGEKVVGDGSTQLVVFEIKDGDLLQLGKTWKFAADLAIGAVLRKQSKVCGSNSFAKSRQG